MKKLLALIFCFVATTPTHAGWPVSVIGDVPGEVRQLENRVYFMKEVAQSLQQIQQLAEQIEDADYMMSEMVGRAADVAEFVNHLSGPWSLSGLADSETLAQWRRLQGEVDQLKDWRADFSASWSMSERVAGNRYPTIDELAGRYSILQKFLADDVDQHMQNSSILTQRVSKLISPQELRMASKGKMQQNKMLAHMMQMDMAAADALTNVYDLMAHESKAKSEKDQIDLKRSTQESVIATQRVALENEKAQDSIRKQREQYAKMYSTVMMPSEKMDVSAPYLSDAKR